MRAQYGIPYTGCMRERFHAVRDTLVKAHCESSRPSNKVQISESALLLCGIHCGCSTPRATYYMPLAWSRVSAACAQTSHDPPKGSRGLEGEMTLWYHINSFIMHCSRYVNPIRTLHLQYTVEAENPGPHELFSIDVGHGCYRTVVRSRTNPQDMTWHYGLRGLQGGGWTNHINIQQFPCSYTFFSFSL